MTNQPMCSQDLPCTLPSYDALLGHLDAFPFTFTYQGRVYAGFAGFKVLGQTSRALRRGTETETLLTHPEIPATFRLVSQVFPAESAYTYAIYIQNTSMGRTGQFQNLSYRVTFAGTQATLSGMEGDAGNSWYKEYTHALYQEGAHTFTHTSFSGRPTHVTFPYYQLSGVTPVTTPGAAAPDVATEQDGAFIAIGWPGTWQASFAYAQGVTTLVTGQLAVNTYLEPGETLRMPLMAFVEYRGLDKDAQINAWRHFFIEDIMYRPEGALPQPVVASLAGVVQDSTTEEQLRILRTYEQHGLHMSGLWIDAGWYAGAQGETVPWPATGTQVVDTTRFPDKLSSLGAFCKQRHMQMLLWFEPENIRLDRQAFLDSEPDFRPEWLLSKTMVGTWLEGYLLDLGNAKARAWLLKKVRAVIDQAGVTWYRQDFNGDPAPAWSQKDGEDRQGMTENQYVQGYLAYWDAIQAAYPYMMIDSCASGGGRNDLETMKRSVPLHYSDLFDGGDDNFHHKARMTQSLFAWFPYFKNENHADSLYHWRMSYAPWSNLRMCALDSEKADWGTLQQAYNEIYQIHDFFYSDYYPLTKYSEDMNRWNAWEFYDPVARAGYASLSCNPGCTTLSRRFTLKGLEDTAVYEVTDFDGLVHVTATGAALKQNGLEVTVPEVPYCVILRIQAEHA